MTQLLQKFSVRFQALEVDVHTAQTLTGMVDIGIDVSVGRRVLMLDILAMTGASTLTSTPAGVPLYVTRECFGASMLASATTSEASALFGFSGMVAASITSSSSKSHYKLDTSHLSAAVAEAAVEVLPFGGALTPESLQGMLKVFGESWPAEIEKAGAVVTTKVQFPVAPAASGFEAKIRAARNISSVVREIAAERTEAQTLAAANADKWGPDGPSTDLVRAVYSSFAAEAHPAKAATDWLHYHLV
ncbi:MAG: hypothetical protein JNL82_06705 [Myxococcales bacterium]|nr:hypothetical protein [Myxococcales bacterium]